jgi:hypothetical protein
VVTLQLDKVNFGYNENPFYARVIYKQKEINYETEEWLRLDFNA